MFFLQLASRLLQITSLLLPRLHLKIPLRTSHFVFPLAGEMIYGGKCKICKFLFEQTTETEREITSWALCVRPSLSFAGSAPIGTRFSPDGCLNPPSAGLHTKIQEALKEGVAQKRIPPVSRRGVSFRFSLFNDPIFFVSLTSSGRPPPLSSGFPAECRLVSANVNTQDPL